MTFSIARAATAPHYTHSKPRLAYTRSGDGPPLVFLHGIGGNRHNWRRQTEALRTQFTTIAWDARGYGDSDDVPGPRGFSDFADDLARLLDELDIARAHFVGLSMGARILMDFQPRYADRVTTLTLCNCFYGFEAALSPDKQREYIELRERPLREGKSFAEIAPRLIESLVSPQCPANVRAELRASILALRTESYLKTLRASVTFDRAAELEHMHIPVQLIFSAADQLTPVSIGDTMLGLLPDARLTVLENAGHLSNLEQPAAFNTALREFLIAHGSVAAFA